MVEPRTCEQIVESGQPCGVSTTVFDPYRRLFICTAHQRLYFDLKWPPYFCWDCTLAQELVAAGHGVHSMSDPEHLWPFVMDLTYVGPHGEQYAPWEVPAEALYTMRSGVVEIDKARAMSDDTDLAAPLIALPVPYWNGAGMVILGWEQVYKAHHQKVRSLPSVLLSLEDEQRIRVRPSDQEIQDWRLRGLRTQAQHEHPPPGPAVDWEGLLREIDQQGSG